MIKVHISEEVKQKDSKNNYMNYSIAKLRKALTTKYIGPLMDYASSNRVKEFEKLKNELLEFSEDPESSGCYFGGFYSCIEKGLIRAIRDTRNPDRNKNVELCLEQALAVREMKYEKAAELQKEIEKSESK